MTDQSLQTVFTVVDCLTLIPVLWVSYWAFLGMFRPSVKITAGVGGCVVWTLSVIWLLARTLELIT